MSKKLLPTLALLAFIMVNLLLVACNSTSTPTGVSTPAAVATINPTPKSTGLTTNFASISLSSNWLKLDEKMVVTGKNFPPRAKIEMRIAPIYEDELAVLKLGIVIRDVITVDNNGGFNHSFSIGQESMRVIFAEGVAVVQASTTDYNVNATALFTVVKGTKPQPTVIPTNKPFLFFSNTVSKPGEKLIITGKYFPANTKMVAQTAPEKNNAPVWDKAKNLENFSSDAEGNISLAITINLSETEAALKVDSSWVRIATADNSVAKNVFISLIL